MESRVPEISHRNRRLYTRMGIVADEFEVFVLEVVDIFDGGIEVHLGQLARLAGELGFGLFEMVGVEVEVTKRVDEGAGAQIAYLRHHHREQGIGGDVEGDAKE